jgi:protein TonB
MTSTHRRLGGALSASAFVHCGLGILLLFLFSISSTPQATEAPASVFKYVYIASPGPAGGGGGSTGPVSKPAKAPAPRPVESVPVTPAQVPVEPPRVPAIDRPIDSDFTKVLQSSGTGVLLLGKPGGTGAGEGLGPGRGPGAGPGGGGNSGGGPRQVGNGVTSPSPILQVRPAYTNAAMGAKVQGTVTLELVVKADGTVGNVRVVKSLDRVLGLDQAAIDAARQWVFKPGMFEGRPVDVIVFLVLDFRIH